MPVYTGESYPEQEHTDWLIEVELVDIDRTNFLLADGLDLITARKRI